MNTWTVHVTSISREMRNSSTRWENHVFFRRDEKFIHPRPKNSNFSSKNHDFCSKLIKSYTNLLEIHPTTTLMKTNSPILTRKWWIWPKTSRTHFFQKWWFWSRSSSNLTILNLNQYRSIRKQKTNTMRSNSDPNHHWISKIAPKLTFSQKRDFLQNSSKIFQFFTNSSSDTTC